MCRRERSKALTEPKRPRRPRPPISADSSAVMTYLSELEAYTSAIEAAGRQISLMVGEQNTRVGYQDAMLRESASRMAAILEACEALAAFIEAYTPDSPLARQQPTFYSIFRVYGKNARAAAAAVRPQADALLAELAAARTALNQIDRHIVGACESPAGGMPEPCEECGEMREIASQALKAMKEVRLHEES